MAERARHNGARPRSRDEEQHKLVLVGDDEADVRDVLVRLLSDPGEPYTPYEVIEAETGQEALGILTGPEDERPSLALLDINMPDMSGIEIFQRMQEQGVDIPVIMITGMSAGSLAIKAIQLGAADYIQKPLETDYILAAIAKALRNEEIKRGAGPKLVPQSKVEPSERIVGSTGEMLRIFKTIGQVARTSATVLVTGDTGTGKELMAEAIHGASDRRAGPLIKVNCAALPETLLESELFGHEKGAFTSAIAQHKGRFELAHKGTIFLDEIGEMTLGTQKKLLRVLQEKEFERVGGTVPVKVDVRVIAATNRNLREEVAANRFREDLFYRLNVIAIHMPPLRERMEDVPAMVNHFLNKHRYTPASPPARITEEAMDRLMHYEWPGNVRELENIILRAVVLSRGAVITSDYIVFVNELNRYVLDVEQKVRSRTPLHEMLREVTKEAVAAALRLNDDDLLSAAHQLGVSEDELKGHIAEFKLLPGAVDQPASAKAVPSPAAH
jgi:two-component system, NtrC family, response regulator AtoC